MRNEKKNQTSSQFLVHWSINLAALYWPLDEQSQSMDHVKEKTKSHVAFIVNTWRTDSESAWEPWLPVRILLLCLLLYFIIILFVWFLYVGFFSVQKNRSYRIRIVTTHTSKSYNFTKGASFNENSNHTKQSAQFDKDFHK